MADSRWISTDGRLGTTTSYSPTGVPIVGGNLFFDGTSQMDVVDDLDEFALFAMNKVWVQRAYEGDIGADGNAWQLSAKYLIHNGAGSLFHDAVSGATTPYVIVDSPNMQDAYILTDTDGAGGIDYTWAILNGKVKVLDNSSTVLGNFLVGPGRTSQPIVDIGLINSSVYYRQAGGLVTTKTALGSSASTSRTIIDGGTLIYHADATGSKIWNKVEITGGAMIFNGLGVSGGVHMGECTITSGTLDMTRDSRAKVITTLRLMPGANFFTHSNITVTNLIDLRGTQPVLP